MMAIDPRVVRIPAAVPGRTEALADLLPELRAHGVRAVSPNGVLGDPTGASEGEGKQLLKAATARLTTAVCRWLARGAER
jgi:creatinine amidohydrolase